MRLLLICAMLLATSAVAAAQAVVGRTTGGPVTPPNPLLERMGRDPGVYSRSVRGVILRLDSARGLLMIEGVGKTQLTFTFDAKVRVRADKDTPLGGRKDLSLTDYTPGQVVKVSYRVSDNKALEIRLKRARS